MSLCQQLVALVLVQRLAELAWSRRNERRLRAAGGTEEGAGHYPHVQFPDEVAAAMLGFLADVRA